LFSGHLEPNCHSRESGNDKDGWIVTQFDRSAL
jgi:hypothetical protein